MENVELLYAQEWVVEYLRKRELEVVCLYGLVLEEEFHRTLGLVVASLHERELVEEYLDVKVLLVADGSLQTCLVEDHDERA